MDGKRFLNSVKFTNLLSFGPEGMELELQPLNVLIGPNGCGKSNFIDAMRILQAIPVDLSLPFSKGDTVNEWLYKNGIGNLFCVKVSINESIFKTINDQNELNGNVDYTALINASKPRASFYQEIINGSEFNNGTVDSVVKTLHIEQQKAFSVDGKSIEYAYEIYTIASMKDIRIYSDYELGRYSKIRMPQNASLDPGDIFEGFGNLSLVINDLISQPKILNLIIEKMKIFYENIVNINTRVAFGTIQIYLQELGLPETIPATRLSDGTIRFLSLLAILLHPEPPPLICIEEPEIGMHPDILSTIAELLINASKRTQLIITTHSDILLSAIGKTCPEAVVVCEKGPNGTRMRRPDPEQLNKWMEENSDLGGVWMSGLIGGTRW